MFYLFLAKQFIRTQWRSQNEYRFSFIMGILVLSRILSGSKPSHIQSNKKEARHKLF